MITKHVKENTTTNNLNYICHNYITKVLKAYPATLNYKEYPKSICTSINTDVCHGIPNNRKLKNGDILNIDLILLKDGYHGDTSKMFKIGNIDKKTNKLINIAQECLYKAIKNIHPEKPINIIGNIIDTYAQKNKCSVIKEYCGHGIGTKIHEKPYILHYKCKKKEIKMQPGMIFTIEPIISLGNGQTKISKDGWTVIPTDKSLSAQWEHTVLVTRNGCKVLTKRIEENI